MEFLAYIHDQVSSAPERRRSLYAHVSSVSQGLLDNTHMLMGHVGVGYCRTKVTLMGSRMEMFVQPCMVHIHICIHRDAHP